MPSLDLAPPAAAARRPPIPPPRGPLSGAVLARLSGRDAPSMREGDLDGVGEPLDDDDLHLALYCLYELHYRGFAGVRDELEWDPTLLSWRALLERAFLARLREVIPDDAEGGVALRRPVDVVAAVCRAVRDDEGPPLSRVLLQRGTRPQLQEFAIHRSAYQLKEADPHTWAVPRLSGTAKAALVHIQTDEYGGGVLEHMHSTLFVDTMDALGLDPSYGAYLHCLPGSTLATVNLVSCFGLHRRWRGALAGHLAVFEMTSVTPMRRYADTFSRLGYGVEARRFYDVHVAADADHEVVALRRLVGGLVADEPDLGSDVVFGARAVLEIERRFASHLLSSWGAGRSSLRGVGDVIAA